MEFFDSNSHLRGMKRDLYEGGIRVPLIVRWPGKIEAGSTTDHISAFQDFLPTFADLADAETPDEIDGISFAPTLLGHTDKQQPHEYLYWEFTEQQGKRAVRQRDWKLVQTKVSTSNPSKPELYDLKDDAGEKNNVAADHPDIIKELSAIMDQSHQSNEDYPLFADEKK